MHSAVCELILLIHSFVLPLNEVSGFHGGEGEYFDLRSYDNLKSCSNVSEEYTASIFRVGSTYTLRLEAVVAQTFVAIYPIAVL
jgi:hypothetical protein